MPYFSGRFEIFKQFIYFNYVVLQTLLELKLESFAFMNKKAKAQSTFYSLRDKKLYYIK